MRGKGRRWSGHDSGKWGRCLSSAAAGRPCDRLGRWVGRDGGERTRREVLADRTGAGDPRRALVIVDDRAPTREVDCDVLVVGGGLGGVAAAWAAARRGHRVCLLEETDWLGGQMTSQGVSALDEHEHIEVFGGTRTYYQLRENIRNHYRRLIANPGPSEALNPGSCWVTRLAFEPLIGQRVLKRLLAPEVEAGSLQIFLRTKTVANPDPLLRWIRLRQ